MLEILDSGIISHDPAIGTFFPAITQLRDGSFICAQQLGEGLALGNSAIQILRSADGRVWEADAATGELGRQNGSSPRVPEITELADGRLVLRYAACYFAEGYPELYDSQSGGFQVCEVVLQWSDDDGHTWGEPKPVPIPLSSVDYAWCVSGRLTILPGGRWMCPLETGKPIGKEGRPDQKAAAAFSNDHGETWPEFVVFADDTNRRYNYWDTMGAVLPNGRLLMMLWTHVYGSETYINNHYVISEDHGRTWSTPRATNIHGQVCFPIALADGRVVAIYNDRVAPQGIRVAITEDLDFYDLENQVTIFDAQGETRIGSPDETNFIETHLAIAFGRPGGILLSDGTILAFYWCTVDGVSHTCWARLQVN